MSLKSNYHKEISKLCNKLNTEYKNIAIARRITQKVILLLQINKIYVTNINKYKNIKSSFENKNIKIDLANYKIELSLKFQIINILKFFYHYFFNLYTIVINFFLESNSNKIINLIYFGRNRINTYEYKKKLNFLVQNKFISKKSRIIIDFKANHKNISNFYFSKYPVMTSIALSHTIKNKIIFLCWFVLIFIKFIYLFYKSPKLLLISQDLIEYEIVKYLLNKDYKINIYSNISKLTDTPNWFSKKHENLKSYFIWSSIEPFIGKYFNKKEFVLGSIWINYINTHNHVFDTQHYNYLKSRIKKFVNSKIVLISFKTKINLRKKNEQNNLIIFDGNPVDRFNLGNTVIYPFGHLNNLKKFTNDIINVTKEINKTSKNKINLYLKPKQNIKLPITEKYRDFIESSNIKILNKKYDYFKQMNNYFLCIIFPFSSIPYNFPTNFRKKFIFYDPTKELFFARNNNTFKITNSKKKLKSEILKALF